MKTEMTIKKVVDFTSRLESRNIDYAIIAGFGLDGKRGFLTRPHQDLDILCAKDKLPLIEEILNELEYGGRMLNDLYKVFDKEKGKLDVGLITYEEGEAVSYGKNRITRFPLKLFKDVQRVNIEGFSFNVAANELLKTWGTCSQKGNDCEYAETLKVDKNLMKKISRVSRN